VVFVGGHRVDKAGTKIPTDAEIHVKHNPCPYVSRGGLKLKAALEAFDLNPTNRNALDIGASTGGFTDCLLQHGASHVVAVDVGYNQLDYRIRSDDRVTTLERVNFRKLLELPQKSIVEETAPDLAVCDVSFISLKMILPVANVILTRPADVVALIKPQFEAGRQDVGKGGVVRDPEIRQRCIDGIVTFCQEELGWIVCGVIDSPVHGAKKGNVECLMHCRVE